MVIQPVTVKKPKILPSLSTKAISVGRAHTFTKGTSLGANEKFWCLKEVNFSTKTKNSKIASKKVKIYYFFMLKSEKLLLFHIEK